MKKITLKHGLLFFYIFDGILLLLFIFAFLPFAKKNKEPSVPTALLNPNYETEITSIKIASPQSTVTLKKGERYWTGVSTESKEKYVWPADIQNVSNLIECSKQIISVQVKTDNVTAWKSLGVDEEQSTSITFYDSNENILSQVFFGFKDSLSLKLYFRTWTKATVYEGLTSIENFLTTEESFWADPFLFPQCITDYDRRYSETLLRRGKIQNLAPRNGLPVKFNLQKDFENGGIVNYAIYEKDKEFIVIPSFIAGPATSEKDSKLINSINYRYSISAVTCENFLNLMK